MCALRWRTPDPPSQFRETKAANSSSVRSLTKVLVQGRIHYTKWTDAAGVDRYGCEIIAEKIDFLSRPKAAEGNAPELVDRDDEIPF